MTLVVTPFGNGIDIGSGGNVNTTLGGPHNNFGTRLSGGNVGPLDVEGIEEQYILDITYDTFAALGEQVGLVPTFLPLGAKVKSVYMYTITAGVMTGTTPGFKIGTFGSEASNGFAVTQAQAQAAAGSVVDLTSTLAGTWATPLAARTQWGMVLTGTTPALTAGEYRITVVYDRLQKTV